MTCCRCINNHNIFSWFSSMLLRWMSSINWLVKKHYTVLLIHKKETGIHMTRTLVGAPTVTYSLTLLQKNFSYIHVYTLLRNFSSFDMMLLHLKLLFNTVHCTLYNNYASRVLNQNNNIYIWTNIWNLGPAQIIYIFLHTHVYKLIFHSICKYNLHINMIYIVENFSFSCKRCI